MEEEVIELKIDSKGRILLPPSLRRELELESGDVVTLKKSRGGLLMAPGKRRTFLGKFGEIIRSEPKRTGKPQNWSPSRMKGIWEKGTK